MKEVMLLKKIIIKKKYFIILRMLLFKNILQMNFKIKYTIILIKYILN